MSAGRRALIVATYEYADAGLRRLAAPEHDAESLATVLEDPQIADFDVTTLVNQPHHVVGEAIADFYSDARRDDLTLLYFTGHGLKDDEGRLYLAMTNTRRSALMFTAISGAQLNDAMDASPSRRKVLVLDCCYSGAFPAGRTAKADEGVQTLERFQGKGRAVLTASDATQYAFEGDDLQGSGTQSVFTRYLVEAIRSGEADLDEDGDIALDELYSYVYEQVVAEMPQQRPKKQEDVDGRILIARNVHWTLPAHLRHAIESPIAAQRLGAVEGLGASAPGGQRRRAGGRRGEAGGPGGRRQPVGVGGRDHRTGPDQRPGRRRRRFRLRGRSRQRRRFPSPAPNPAPVARARARARRRALAGRLGAYRRGSGRAPRPRSRRRPPREAESHAARGSSSALVVLSALPLTLSRLLAFESSYPDTADEFSESTVPWSLFVVLPLVAAAGLLAARRSLPRALPAAFGLVLGGGLVLVEHAVFWVFYFVENRGSYSVGPALWLLVAGAVVVAAAGSSSCPGLRGWAAPVPDRLAGRLRVRGRGLRRVVPGGRAGDRHGVVVVRALRGHVAPGCGRARR